MLSVPVGERIADFEPFSLDLQPPDPGSEPEAIPGIKIRRRDVLGELIHQYHRIAA